MDKNKNRSAYLFAELACTGGTMTAIASELLMSIVWDNVIILERNTSPKLERAANTNTGHTQQ